MFPDFPYPDAAAVAIGMTGKTTAKYPCPCSDEETGFQGQSFWVELTGPGGWPSLLSGRCLRCGDNWVGRHLHSPTDTESSELGIYAIRRRTARGLGEVVSFVVGKWELDD